ncbi:hypothetical protein ACFWY9_32130 [Amycolatopsis sp. NPDC059027]|uniref:hypothetical protein n=1 Tax=unclassified Amycolatopsis TaxID=2618356 RepID=UPI00366B555B
MIKAISGDVVSVLADLGVDVKNCDRSTELEIAHFDQWANGNLALSPTSLCTSPVLEAA